MATPSTTFDARWQHITQVWQRYFLEYRMLLIVALVVAGLWVFGSNGLSMLDDMLGYVTNVFTEALSIIVTVLVLDRLNERRADQRADAALKADLVRRAGSVSNAFAVDAVAELRKRWWLENDKGLLQGADLRYADLRGANLRYANLRAAIFYVANLSQADLYSANLRWVGLYEANLSGADLRYTNLRGAELDSANLSAANLQNANLLEAEGVEYIVFDQQTVLPDAKPRRDVDGRIQRDKAGNRLYSLESYWTPDTDIMRYTSPTHPHFWQPEWAAAGFVRYLDWQDAREPEPWRDAGFGDDHMAWVRAGKPGPQANT